MAKPDWDKEFEIKCDASDNAMGAVLGQRTDKMFYIMPTKPLMKLKRITQLLKRRCWS